MNAIIKKLGFIELLKSIYSILNNIPFFYYSLLYIIFILFNATEFTQSGSQIEILKHTIYSLLIFTLITFSFSSLRNKSSLISGLEKNKGFISIISFIVFFLVFGVIFASFEGKLDTNFVTGIFTNSLFLLNYMFIVAVLEEFIFREGLIDYLKSKSTNLMAVYILSALIFASYHYFKYSANFSMLFIAFLAGIGFTWIKLQDNIFGFDTYPISVALHLVFNLSSIGALNIVFNMMGVVV